MEKLKVIIDTDIGDDIDDTLAIALALSMPESFDIIGVTTVFNDTRLRAKSARVLLDAFGKTEVPVIAGFSKTEGGFFTPDPFLKEELPYAFDTEFIPNEREEDAVDFIIENCNKYGKDLVLIPLGPFTNIAKAIKKDKAAVSKAGKVVLMGGAFYKQYADWNVFCDPPSAKTVFDNLDNIFALGADVTHKLTVPEETLYKLTSYKGESKGIKLVSDAVNAWQKGGKKLWGNKPNVMLHDPLAVYSAIDSSFVTTEKIMVKVITDGVMKGFTFNANAYSKSHLNDDYDTECLNTVTVARDVDAKGFIDKYFSVILQNHK